MQNIRNFYRDEKLTRCEQTSRKTFIKDKGRNLIANEDNAENSKYHRMIRDNYDSAFQYGSAEFFKRK